MSVYNLNKIDYDLEIIFNKTLKSRIFYSCKNLEYYIDPIYEGNMSIKFNNSEMYINNVA